MNGRLLVFNCHEAWVHQLRLLNRPLDIVVDLSGRHTRCWDEAMRPVPPNSRLVTLHDVLAASENYDCILAHNLTDLLDVKSLPGPRLLVLHITLESMVLEQHAQTPADEFRRTAADYLEKARAHVVAVTTLKGRSWGFSENIVHSCADPADYLPWQGDLARGLRVANFVLRRPRYLLWDFHQRAFAGLPVTLVGHNPEIPGAQASSGWGDLKQTLCHHRFFIHTADPQLEDGFNMAMLEAMAAGLPVLGNRHPSSPIVHGVSGFLSDNPAELHSFAQLLLDHLPLAAGMGRAARRTVIERFPPEAFRCGMERAITAAKAKYQEAFVSSAH
jgi:hypothetical protein